MANKLTAKFKSWLALKTEKCKDVAPLFSYSYDRQLSLGEKFRLKLHLFTCGACTNYVSNLKFMHEVFHLQKEQIETEKAQPRLSAEAKERLKQKLKSQN